MKFGFMDLFDWTCAAIKVRLLLKNIKITEIVLKKFNIRLNYIIVSFVLITITIIILLINL